MNDLERLWQIADSASLRGNTSRDGLFEPIGLILGRPLQRATYRTTPANTLAFAWTGGDGIHFNFVLRDGAIQHDSPVVMAVPMSFKRPNVIVGRDLRDFLALGTGRGFFVLEQLAYQPEAFLGAYPATADELSERARQQIALIRNGFGVEPWANPRARLEELKDLEALLEQPAAQPPSPPGRADVARIVMQRLSALPPEQRTKFSIDRLRDEVARELNVTIPEKRR
jgi:hypothetical protein